MTGFFLISSLITPLPFYVPFPHILHAQSLDVCLDPHLTFFFCSGILPSYLDLITDLCQMEAQSSYIINLLDGDDKPVYTAKCVLLLLAGPAHH